MAKKLNAFLVINDEFHKPCDKKCDKCEDFNHLPPMIDEPSTSPIGYQGKKYDWSKRAPEMEQFYTRIENYAAHAASLNKSNNKKCLVLFIHGLSHDTYDVDLGAGAKSAPNMVINADQHIKSKDNTGTITAPINFLEKFKSVLEDAGLKVGAGDVFSAWDEQNGAQYLRNMGHDYYTVQMEINTNLRDDPKKTADLLSNAVQKMDDYSESIFYLPQEAR
jgi:hypothetical protein